MSDERQVKACEAARAIAHRITPNCRGGEPWQHGDGTRWHTARCEETGREIVALILATIAAERRHPEPKV